ncbi:thiolase-like protein [Mycena maculata]|uniref:Thiolase-like protein n=1 Tax=Mycena maculata TaxID=230809 RepID=A0AAD7MFR3_9AGAR|nr:thiolase-like protein [Mycena maculata]
MGMACRMPGGAHNPEAFWELLKDRACTMQVVPPSGFNIADYLTASSGDVDHKNKMNADKGHFLTEALCFDEQFFNMSPRQALNTDPQQRVLLETVVDALDDAGYRPADEGGEVGWNRDRIGMFAASAITSYEQNSNMTTDIDAFYVPGVARGFISGRASHFFKWQGPAITYDAACASGLVAVHAACQSLILHETDVGVVSGTNIITSPEFFIGLNKGFFVSSTDGCRTFDQTGDGYCRGESVAAVVLKRLEDALRDNDRIEGIILSSGVNHSGRAESLTAPHIPSLASLLAQNCTLAGVSPLSVRAVEMHGTGTQVGDYAEIEAVKLAFTVGRPSVKDGQTNSELLVSSIKPNVGHSESTAGIASLIKAILALRYRQATPHTGIKTVVNPRLGDLSASGIVIPKSVASLTALPGEKKIIISVNSFGAQGSNANLLVSEYLPESEQSCRTDVDCRSYHIVALSGKPHTPFQFLVDRLSAHLDQNPNTDLASLSYTTTARRVDYPARVTFSVSTIDELKAQLTTRPRPADTPKHAPKIGFVLGGNGSQFRAMGKTLYDSSSSFRHSIDECREALKSAVSVGEIGSMDADGDVDVLMGAISGAIDPLVHDTFQSTLAASVGVVAVEYALGKLWVEWDVHPSVILGHSLGEYAGLVLAGALSLVDVMKLTVAKCSAMHEAELQPETSCGMLALGCAVEEALVFSRDSHVEGLEIACFNGPSQTVFSGPQAELEKLLTHVRATAAIPAKILPGPYAWHSSYVSTQAARVTAASSAITLSAVVTPMVLNTDGSALLPGQHLSSAGYLGEQMKSAVRWDRCVAHPLCADVDIWIELSPKSILIPLLRTSLTLPGRTFLPTLNGAVDAWNTVTKAIGRLYEAHVPINWAKYHAEYPVHLVRLPSYPFARNEHYIPYVNRLGKGGKEKSAQRGVLRIVTPLGALDIEDAGKRYSLQPSAGKIGIHEYLWLAMTCAQTTQITDLHMFEIMDQSTRLSIIISEDGSISFSSDSNTLVARGTFSASTRSLLTPTSQHLIRARKRLLKDTKTSSFSSTAIARLLDEPPEYASRAVVASECDEVISIVPFSLLDEQVVVPEADGVTPPCLANCFSP